MNSSIVASLLAGRILGTTDNSFVIAEWRDAGAPPGPPRWIAPLHMHNNDDEAWYVLEGKLCVKVGDDTVEASAGAAVLVKPSEVTPLSFVRALDGWQEIGRASCRERV